MNAEPGSAKEVVREFVARLNSGLAPWSLMTEDAVVTVNGTTPLSGRYTGLTMVHGILVDTARAVIGSIEIGLEQSIGAGSRVAALLRVSGCTIDGTTFNTRGHVCGCVFGVDDGRICEVILYPDTS